MTPCWQDWCEWPEGAEQGAPCVKCGAPKPPDLMAALKASLEAATESEVQP